MKIILKDGSALSYCYRLADNEATQKDPDSLICRYDALVNSESMVLRRNAIPEEFCRDGSGFVYCSIEDYGSQSMTDAALPRYLSGDAAFTFYTTCILPDLKDTELGKTHITSFSQETKMSDSAAIYVSFFLDPTNEQINAYIDRVYAGAPGSYSDHFGYTITKDARGCLSGKPWLQLRSSCRITNAKAPPERQLVWEGLFLRVDYEICFSSRRFRK